MKLKCVCTSLVVTLVSTLLVTLILGLVGVTTITVTSPIVLAAILFTLGLVVSVISFVTLTSRNFGTHCYTRCYSLKLFLLLLFAIGLIVFTLIGFVTFLSDATVGLIVFAIGLFLLLGILFTSLSITFPLINRNTISE